MSDMFIFSAIGLISVILGVLLLKKEKQLFKDSVTTHAKVVTYYDYINHSSSMYNTMYTMAVEYYLPDGKLIHAREQKGSTSKKYDIGAELDIVYCKEKPDFFVVKGDKSRIYIFYGMIIVGALMVLTGIFVGI